MVHGLLFAQVALSKERDQVLARTTAGEVSNTPTVVSLNERKTEQQ